jgi:hypothetical protein
MCSRSVFLCGAFAVAGCFMIRRRRLFSWPTSVWLLIPILLDALTQSAGWRESTNPLRVLTGTLGGVGLAGLVLRGQVGAFAKGSAARGNLSPPIPMPRCLARLLVLALLAAGVPGVLVRAETESVSLPDRPACETYANASGDAVQVEWAPDTTLSSSAANPLICLANPLLLPAMTAADFTKEGLRIRRVRRDTRERAMHECLEPSVLAQRLGPEHPEVAQSLHNLATRYVGLGDLLQRKATADGAEGKARGTGYLLPSPLVKRAEREQALALELWKKAEPLYKRALTIREKALGPEHLDVATTLEGYGALLRNLNRGAEAERMEARAKASREKAEKKTASESPTDTEHNEAPPEAPSVGP